MKNEPEASVLQAKLDSLRTKRLEYEALSEDSRKMLELLDESIAELSSQL